MSVFLPDAEQRFRDVIRWRVQVLGEAKVKAANARLTREQQGKARFEVLAAEERLVAVLTLWKAMTGHDFE